MVTRKLPDTTGAPQVVPDTDMRTRDTRPRTAPDNDGATALSDKRLAEYALVLAERFGERTAAQNAGVDVLQNGLQDGSAPAD